MTDRDRLIELLKPHVSGTACLCESGSCELTSCRDCKARRLADHLLANGVIVPPCKVGDTVYKIIYFRCEKPEKCEMTHCAVKTSKKYDLTTVKTMCLKIIPTPFKLEYLTKLGINVFPTEEEAEQALKECEGK